PAAIKMQLSLTLAAAACMLALCNATITTLGIGTDVNKFIDIDDYECHKHKVNYPTIQIKAAGPDAVTVYSDSKCQTAIRTVQNDQSDWKFITGPIKSYKKIQS
ncbi:hypothetical protein GGI21_002169, partial [Coemansia aciculifera]